MNLEEVKEVIAIIKERTKKNAFSLVINKEKQPGIFDSKIGGVPYWDCNKEYPKDRFGESLILLAQINLDAIDEMSDLPQSGMLQFFIGNDDVYGLDFDEQDKQDTFRVIYHETIDYKITLDEILTLGIPTCTDEEMETPVFKEGALDIFSKEIYMGERDYRFESLFLEIASDKFSIVKDGESLYSLLDDEQSDYIVNELSNTEHWLLGYPFFTQNDPRDYTEKYRYYDTMLFQLDSDYSDNMDYVLWGDCGVANFFINSEDLKNKNFSRVLYNWDCC